MQKNSFIMQILLWGFPWGSVVKNPPVNAWDLRVLAWIPGWGGRSPGGGNDNPLLYSCQDNPSHGQSCLVGYSPWGHKELDRLRLSMHTLEFRSFVCFCFFLKTLSFVLPRFFVQKKKKSGLGKDNSKYLGPRLVCADWKTDCHTCLNLWSPVGNHISKFSKTFSKGKRVGKEHHHFNL